MKPCPFCGATTGMLVFHPESRRRIAIECTYCEARGPTVFRVSPIAERLTEQDRAAAVATWDERVPK